MRKRYRLIACALMLANQQLWGCTVFFAFDGKLALAGDNEDYSDHPHTQMWTVPAQPGTHGVIYFGFGRGAYPAQGAALTLHVRQALAGSFPLDELQIEDAYGYPQQGMNDQGLFFGGAWTETVSSKPSAKPVYDGVLVDHILRHAANVQEALELLRAYSFPGPEGQLLFADRSGNSFIWEAGDAVIPGSARFQAIANFLQSRKPEESARNSRYRAVDARLRDGPELSHDLVKDLLRETEQPITQYSLVFDLTNLTVDVYQHLRFSSAVTIHLPGELAKGPEVSQIGALFKSAP